MILRRIPSDDLFLWDDKHRFRVNNRHFFDLFVPKRIINCPSFPAVVSFYFFFSVGLPKQTNNKVPPKKKKMAFMDMTGINAAVIEASKEEKKSMWKKENGIYESNEDLKGGLSNPDQKQPSFVSSLPFPEAGSPLVLSDDEEEQGFFFFFF